jgi:hypothetical protein
MWLGSFENPCSCSNSKRTLASKEKIAKISMQIKILAEVELDGCPLARMKRGFGGPPQGAPKMPFCRYIGMQAPLTTRFPTLPILKNPIPKATYLDLPVIF